MGINLPAYLGGITLQNKSIEQFDICEVLSYLKGNIPRIEKSLFSVLNSE